MSEKPVVLITGASGNLGAKLRRHLESRFELRFLDRDSRGDRQVLRCDLSEWDPQWVDAFRGVHTVVHLAADACAYQHWPELVGPNIDATLNVFQAAALAAVPRVVYASSNHVFADYKHDAGPRLLTPDLAPRPGTRYVVDGRERESFAYAATKLFGERVGKCFAEAYGRTVIAVRIGWVRPGGNRADDIPREREEWFRLIWLSDRDFCQLMEKCIRAAVPSGFHVINGMSANTGSRWDLSAARKLVGYEPLDDITRASAT
jgi:nucleoside-diphosphate-sugar epimerase